MADERRRNLLQDAFAQIARLTGVNVNESSSTQINSSNNTSTPRSVNEELSLRFPLLRMPTSSRTNTNRGTTSTFEGSSTNSSSSRINSSRAPTNRKRKRKVDKTQKVVYKDLVFIPDPEEGQVPTHTARVNLETDGKVVHGFPVDASWDARTLRNEICDQIPELLFSEFEYIKACYGKLVPLNLANGVEATAEIILKVAGQGAIYLRRTQLDEDFDDSELMHSALDFQPRNISTQNEATHLVVSNQDGSQMASSQEIIAETFIQPGALVTERTSQPQTFVTANEAVTQTETLFTDELDETLSDLTDDETKAVKDILVHRTNVMKDILQEFKDKELLNFKLNLRVMASNGTVEKGEGTGVVREILTLFWQSFYMSLAVGAKEKVPSIRHDFQSNDWQAVARVLIFGYTSVGYFPLNLSVAFVALCLFGEEKVPNDLLLDSFKLYVSADEKQVIDNCFNGKFNSQDEDTLEFLSSYKCFRNPSEENIADIIFQLAHQEIFQRPKYIAACWSAILKSLTVFDPFRSVIDLKRMIQDKSVSTKKVLKLLSANPSNDAERVTLDHLKRFVKSLSEGALAAFLQFTTGSDIVVCDSLEIHFVSLDGLARRPIAHTCLPSLELPTTYQSYNELCEEFSGLLREKSFWEFDIV